jgi:hypothetical protein
MSHLVTSVFCVILYTYPINHKAFNYRWTSFISDINVKIYYKKDIL